MRIVILGVLRDSATKIRASAQVVDSIPVLSGKKHFDFIFQGRTVIDGKNSTSVLLTSSS